MNLSNFYLNKIDAYKNVYQRDITMHNSVNKTNGKQCDYMKRKICVDQYLLD